MDKDLYIELENVTIQCDTGYGIVNNQNITCSENRTWYPEVPTCKWVSGTHFKVLYHILKMAACSRALSQPTLMICDFCQDSFLCCLNNFGISNFIFKALGEFIKAISHSLI